MRRGIAILIVGALLLGGLGLAAQPWTSRAAGPTFVLLGGNGWSDPAVGSWDLGTMTGTLTTNLVNTGIMITANNVVLDGNGHTLTGNGGGAGVYLLNRSGVTVRNVTASGFQYGIFVNGAVSDTAPGNKIVNNTVSGNNSYGIYVYHCNNNTLSGNTSSANGSHGISLSGSHGNTLQGNTSTGNADDGIRLDLSNKNTLSDNTAEGNENGFDLNGSNNNLLTGNTVSGNHPYGLLMKGATGNQVYNNRFKGNGTHASVNSAGNFFYRSEPKGGNYWDNWTSPDTNGDHIVDNAYTFDTSQTDEYPWADPDGWLLPQPSSIPEPTIGAAFVTGGGWINPPAASTRGKVHLEVVCRYAGESAVPTGEANVQLGRGVQFHSTAYDLLVIDEGQAWCHGQGRVGGKTYEFILAVGEGKARIKIWDGASVLYDSEPGADDWAPPEAELGGGRITIHKE